MTPMRVLADYTVQRVLTGLNQPTYLTQAPGDNVDLFIAQRKDPDESAGEIIQYNKITHTTTTFLDISGPVYQDGGLLSFAFSQKMSQINRKAHERKQKF